VFVYFAHMMTKSVRYISISHKTASVSKREQYYIPEIEKEELAADICSHFSDIEGLLLLVTCNRVEIYFESAHTTASSLCRYFIERQQEGRSKGEAQLFKTCDSTESTLQHLLRVSSGLSSQVMGDTEIVHQIKKAHLFSLGLKLQGSLLERAIQTVFKTHKRISNETEFRDGTTSVAYKALKVVGDTFKGKTPSGKKILLIGTGDIVHQLLKYNSKFNFTNLYISNRTREKAIQLAEKHQCGVYDWQRVLANDFGDFDVLISAAGNCRHLIREVRPDDRPRLLIDLALPGNIDRTLENNDHITFYDLDAISSELEETKDRRVASIALVKMILKEELYAYMDWYRDAPLRAFLANYKVALGQRVEQYYESRSTPYDAQTIARVTDRVMRKLIKNPELKVPARTLNALIEQHACPAKA